MTNTLIAMLFSALFLVSCAPSVQKNSYSGSIDKLFSDYSQLAGPGASVAVLKDGRIFFSRAYGLADLEAGIPATTGTNYRLASVTKQFTATAVLMLAGKGKLSLDSRLTDVLPGAPPYLRDVKIRHLLNHTSGIVDYEDLIPDSQTVQVHDKDVLTLLRRIDSVYFAPGAKFKYSNSGYSLLALVVEAISGESFAEYLTKNIFVPLHMDHTLAYQEGISSVENRAYGYSRTDVGFVRTDQSVTSAVLGDGGIYSSVDDLFHWALALDSRPLVPTSLHEEAHTQGRLTDGSSTSYGFGWYIEPYKNLPTYYHTGSTRGFRNAILRIPGQHLTIIILTNRNEGDPIEIARKIADLMLIGLKPQGEI